MSREKNVALTDLPDSTIEQRSDLVNALKRGAGMGAATGLLAGLVVMTFPASGLVIGGGALAAMTAGGAAFGAWSASLIGVSEQHPIVEEFDRSLEDGGFLIVADTGREEDDAYALVRDIARDHDVSPDRYGIYA